VSSLAQNADGNQKPEFPVSDDALVFVFWLAADFVPVFFTDIVVDLDGAAPCPMAIWAVLFAAGDPVLVAGFDIAVVAADTGSFERFEACLVVVHGAARFGEADATNAGGARVATVAFEFYVHDPRLHMLPFRTIRWGILPWV